MRSRSQEWRSQEWRMSDGTPLQRLPMGGQAKQGQAFFYQQFKYGNFTLTDSTMPFDLVNLSAASSVKLPQQGSLCQVVLVLQLQFGRFEFRLGSFDLEIAGFSIKKKYILSVASSYILMVVFFCLAALVKCFFLLQLEFYSFLRAILI